MNQTDCVLEAAAVRGRRITAVRHLFGESAASRFTRAAILIVGGTAGAQIIQLVASPFIARLYSPAEFGVLAAFAGLLSIISVAASLRYDEAIPLAIDSQSAVALIALAIFLVVLTTISLAMLLAFTRDVVDYTTWGQLLRPHLWLVLIGFAIMGTYSVLSYWALRAQLYGSVARTNLSQAVTGISTQIALGWLGVGPVGLLLGFVASRGAGVALLTRQFARIESRQLCLLRVAEIRQAAGRFSDFPRFQVAAAVLSNGAVNVTALLLLSWYGPEVAGCFYLTQKTIAVPVTLIGSSVSNVFIAEGAALVRSDPRAFRALFSRTNRYLLALAIAPGLLLMLYGPQIFALTFGSRWSESGVYVQLLAPVMVLRLSTAVVNLQLIERQGLNLIWTAVRVLGTVASVLVPVSFGLSARVAVASYAGVMLTTYFVKYALWYSALHRLSGEGVPSASWPAGDPIHYRSSGRNTEV